MKARIQRWGNSLALRIPKTFAEGISVCEGDEIEMNVTKGKLVIASHPPRDYRLADLVAGIRPGNLHREIVTGGPQGHEVW